MRPLPTRVVFGAEEGKMPATIDRYVFRIMALRFLAVAGIVVAILTLENMSRLAADVDKTVSPLKLLGWLSLLLVPEQLSAAMPVALFLGVAFGVRQLSLRGEWGMLAASGMSGMRVMVAPMLLGLTAATLQMVNRLEVQPAGERGLDALYLAMKGGVHGVPVSLGEPITLDAQTTLVATPAPGHAPGSLVKVLVQHGEQVFTAPTATVAALSDGVIALDLFNGIALSGLKDATAHSVGFRHMRLFGRPPMIELVGKDPRHRLERQGLTGLLAIARGAAPEGDGDAAMAALAMRIDSALFCLMLPWMALALGLPSQRSATAYGLGWGLLLVVAHLKSAAYVEDSFAHWAIPAAIAHGVAWGLVTGMLVRAQARLGEGWADLASQRIVRQLLAAVQRRRVQLARPLSVRRAAA
jgi:lipopolysaccharide export system permease protein